MFRRILDSPYFLYGLAALLLIAGVLSMFRVELPNRSVGDVQDIADLGERDDLNVVFILIDTLRADRLGSYGYERDTSPVMDLLAQGGVRFAKAEAQSSWTKTSMASLWTGLFPPRTGILRFDDGLPESATLPAEILEEAGYVTGGIFRNGWVGANFGFKQGFQTYLKPEGREDPDGVESSLPGTTKLPGTDVDVTLAGLEFLRTHAHNKFFLYLHYMDIHQYTYEKGYADLYEGATISDNYDRAIRWTDKQVDRVVQELEDRGIMERTIIVIASDHGEAFLEHGKEGHAPGPAPRVDRGALHHEPPLHRRRRCGGRLGGAQRRHLADGAGHPRARSPAESRRRLPRARHPGCRPRRRDRGPPLLRVSRPDLGPDGRNDPPAGRAPHRRPQDHVQPGRGEHLPVPGRWPATRSRPRT